MTMHREEITDAAEIARLESELQDRQSIPGADVFVGEHPERGHTVLIKASDGTAVVLSDTVRFLASA